MPINMVKKLSDLPFIDCRMIVAVNKILAYWRTWYIFKIQQIYIFLVHFAVENLLANTTYQKFC